ncbi:GntR family transcriptional regulator [Saccharopolyspora sp. ASAGF58]|uniref:GntR family transcriptional regulator n=1 Tax=Saccharopolyspora sp. ASAGF58 TaxID=2719023 RepID=UPI001B303777|nr:GntR family transcriptional regulator [Saccharopolyspora sp. ASAGF58]
MLGSDRGPRTPKYAVIAADLEAKIKAGMYESGQALPAQRELSTAYGVTLMTLRQALQVLAERGLVTREAGRGTFVTAPKAVYNIGSLQSLSDELRAQGHPIDTVLLSRTRRKLPGWVAVRLGREAGAPAVRVERLRRVGGVPAIHQVSWLPEAVAGPLAHVDFTSTSLYGALAETGAVVERATERLNPGVLSARLGKILEKPTGVPVFLSDRVTYSAGDEPVLFDRATILGEFIEVRTDRAASAVSVLWTRAGQETSA